MEINKVHCFFEQSGTFKNEFKQLGITAFDYDIENNFKETDFKLDLFFEIEKCMSEEKNIFDTICQKDLIFAFFPCTYFSGQSKLESRADSTNYNNLSKKYKLEHSIDNNEQRLIYYIKLCNFIQICLDRKIKLIIENPWHDNFLNNYLPKVEDDIVLFRDRNKFGDYYRKPTAFRFYNCIPEFNLLQENKLYECKTVESKKNILAEAKYQVNLQIFLSLILFYNMEKYEYVIVAHGQIQETFDSYSMAYKFIICQQYKEAEILQVVTKYKYKQQENGQ